MIIGQCSISESEIQSEIAKPEIQLSGLREYGQLRGPNDGRPTLASQRESQGGRGQLESATGRKQ